MAHLSVMASIPAPLSVFLLLHLATPLAKTPYEYDMTMFIPAIETIIQNKGINVHSRDPEKFKVGLPLQCVIGLLGVAGKGRTFVMNELLGGNKKLEPKDITSHTKTKEQGIHMYYAEKPKNWLLLDTFGLLPTVSQKETPKEKQPVGEVTDVRLGRDAINVQCLREQILVDIVLQLSDMIVFVVSDMSFEEQQWITNIYEMFFKPIRRGDGEEQSKDRRSKGQIVVVHNYKDIAKFSDAREMFAEQVEKKYNGNRLPYQDKKYGCTYVQKISAHEVSTGITHYCLMKSGGVGDLVNQANMDLIIGSIKSTFDVLKLKNEKLDDAYGRKINNFIERQLEITLRKYMALQNFEYHESRRSIKIRYDSGFFVEEEDRKRPLIAKKTSSDTCGSSILPDINNQDCKPLGQPIEYKMLSPDKTMLFWYFEVDAPGVRLEDVTIERRVGKYFLVVVKREATSEKKRNKVLKGLVKQSEKEYEIEIHFRNNQGSWKRITSQHGSPSPLSNLRFSRNFTMTNDLCEAHMCAGVGRVIGEETGEGVFKGHSEPDDVNEMPDGNFTLRQTMFDRLDEIRQELIDLPDTESDEKKRAERDEELRADLNREKSKAEVPKGDIWKTKSTLTIQGDKMQVKSPNGSFKGKSTQIYSWLDSDDKRNLVLVPLDTDSVIKYGYVPSDMKEDDWRDTSKWLCPSGVVDYHVALQPGNSRVANITERTFEIVESNVAAELADTGFHWIFAWNAGNTRKMLLTSKVGKILRKGIDDKKWNDFSQWPPLPEEEEYVVGNFHYQAYLGNFTQSGKDPVNVRLYTNYSEVGAYWRMDSICERYMLNVKWGNRLQMRVTDSGREKLYDGVETPSGGFEGRVADMEDDSWPYGSFELMSGEDDRCQRFNADEIELPWTKQIKFDDTLSDIGSIQRPGAAELKDGRLKIVAEYKAQTEIKKVQQALSLQAAEGPQSGDGEGRDEL